MKLCMGSLLTKILGFYSKLDEQIDGFGLTKLGLALADLDIVVDPGNPVPRNKMRVAETFGLNSRYFDVNSDICRESSWFL